MLSGFHRNWNHRSQPSRASRESLKGIVKNLTLMEIASNSRFGVEQKSERRPVCCLSNCSL
ncbi:hypothetical protein OIU79_023881 [Salix purpurea]|uniref:Uncharacterized protein n=1 Tax=Salix purpurea TaxID=77065 RepID=A0A9Q0WCP2_SALPP|nr:hypothetical protein OIU79_023881 [Salix purpurea]